MLSRVKLRRVKHLIERLLLHVAKSIAKPLVLLWGLLLVLKTDLFMSGMLYRWPRKSLYVSHTPCGREKTSSIHGI